MYLLDTTTVSDYLRGNAGILTKLKSISPKLIAISSITKFEIEYGLRKKSSLRKVYQQQLEEIYSQTKDLEFNTVVAIEAAKIRDELVKAGTPIGLADLLISAIARHHKLIVVTSNIKHFINVKDLQLEDWKS
ncbi:MAG: PIN domain-containing protein [Xenococcaceae cyanobacterium MO_234.B1]|nr:PIN domain-containing protein [Xenococcaceae cyanobacterium MO_234.B1]